MSHTVKIIEIEKLTHDVLRIVTEKPNRINYQAGQAVDISINKSPWENELRAFTLTSLPEDQFLEFTIKTYPSHQGVTNEILSLHVGNELIVGDVFGDIHYKGKGVFIAGGAGITPFIAIFKMLEKQGKLKGNKLLFANKTSQDIILEDYFQQRLGNDFINILSDERHDRHIHGYITAELIKKVSNNKEIFYYVCGPDPMMNAIDQHLRALGIGKDKIVREAF
jgi:ferredoxin-NADP reductase